MLGVGQPLNVATCGRLTVAFVPSGLLPVALASFAICDPLALPTVGVGHPASPATRGNWSSRVRCVPSGLVAVTAMPGVSFQSRLDAVGQPDKVETLADMRAAEARSAQIRSPKGVTRSFHVSRYKIEPVERACNLLAKDDCRTALGDELEPDGPQVPLVVEALLLSRRAEWLAGAGTGPNRSVVTPSGASQGVAPDPDSGEEMALREGSKVIGCNLRDAAFVDLAWRDVASVDQVPQPLGRVRVALVVVGGHAGHPAKTGAEGPL